ncbi:hypothetical protein N0V82_005144 [Gnomoniopsis sp. IMI 355080]|nr:hypothetical protein N0V82_005144 [Gnomoniopsis sp. IMI 355080]
MGDSSTKHNESMAPAPKELNISTNTTETPHSSDTRSESTIVVTRPEMNAHKSVGLASPVVSENNQYDYFSDVHNDMESWLDMPSAINTEFPYDFTLVEISGDLQHVSRTQSPRGTGVMLNYQWLSQRYRLTDTAEEVLSTECAYVAALESMLCKQSSLAAQLDDTFNSAEKHLGEIEDSIQQLNRWAVTSHVPMSYKDITGTMELESCKDMKLGVRILPYLGISGGLLGFFEAVACSG